MGHVISRSIGLKPGGNCLPVHQGLACIQGQWTNKLLSVGAPGEARGVLSLAYRYPRPHHPGIVFKLTTNPTDTRSTSQYTLAKRTSGSGISPSHNSIRFCSVSKGLTPLIDNLFIYILYNPIDFICQVV